MGVALLLLAVGAVALSGGARAAVRGAMNLGRAAGVPGTFGMLLFGVHLEPLATALAAAGMGATAIAVGQALGGLVTVLAAAFGVALLATPRPLRSPPPDALAAPALGIAAAALVIADRVVTRLDGALLVALYVAYVFLLTRRPPGEEPDGGGGGDDGLDPVREGDGAGNEPSRGRTVAPSGGGLVAVALSGGGLVAVALGAVALVRGGTALVEQTLLLPGFIGAAVVGALAVADQVVGAVRSARGTEPDLPGEVFASLGAVPTGVLGAAALLRPLSVDSGVTVSVLAVAFLYAVVATAFFARGRAGRGIGAVVLIGYLAWLLWGSSL